MKKNASRSEAARTRFIEWAEANDFTLHRFEWTGSASQYPATCSQGHSCTPRPNSIAQGQGGCKTCGTLASVERRTLAARDAFLSWAVEHGYTLHSFEWQGAHVGYPATCPQGHNCAPRPVGVKRGEGGCEPCRGLTADVFYVVTGPDGVKFGVTSGNPRPRLMAHRRDGYDDVVRLHERLSGTSARDLELELITLMRSMGVRPVRGREYYPANTLNVILAVADEWMGA